MLHGKTIGFFGAGSMAEALIRGLLNGGVVEPGQLLVANRADRGRLLTLVNQFGIRPADSLVAVAEQADVVIVACKPKDVAELLGHVGTHTRPGQVLLSVAAGVNTEALRANLVQGVEVVRAMPNTSSQVGESATAFCLAEGAADTARQISQAILGAVGRVVEVPEHLMDAVTGLSGTGPAYIYFMIEALIAAGRNVGLSAADARTLSIQTLKGAAKMLDQTGEDPAELRRRVTSPGGTTMAGLEVLSQAGFTEAVVQAVARATERSGELGRLALPAQAKR